MHGMGKLRYMTMVVLAAFLMNVLLPFFAVYDLGHQDTKALSAVLGEKVLLCTPEGFKWVDLADIESGKQQPTSHPQFECALCVVAAHGFTSLTSDVGTQVVYTPLATPHHYNTALRATAPMQLHLRTVSSRAPPLEVAA